MIKKFDKDDALNQLRNLRQEERSIYNEIDDFLKNPNEDTADKLDSAFKKSVIIKLAYDQLLPRDKNLVNYRFVLGMLPSYIASISQFGKGEDEVRRGKYNSSTSVMQRSNLILNHKIIPAANNMIETIESKKAQTMNNKPFTVDEVQSCIADYNFDIDSMKETINYILDTHTLVYSHILENLTNEIAIKYISGSQDFLASIYDILAKKESRIKIVRSVVDKSENEIHRKVIIGRYHDNLPTTELANKYYYSNTAYAHDKASSSISHICRQKIKEITDKSNQELSKKIRLKPCLPKEIAEITAHYNETIEEEIEEITMQKSQSMCI